MLGGSLLVAPVMHADGHVDYYLPEGAWTSLLTDKVVRGGGWRRETHDYLSLPLMVRPGSVIPMGRCEEKPDYDYTDGLELHVFGQPEGEVTVKVPDLKGDTAATYFVRMADGQVRVSTDSEKPYSVILHQQENK